MLQKRLTTLFISFLLLDLNRCAELSGLIENFSDELTITLHFQAHDWYEVDKQITSPMFSLGSFMTGTKYHIAIKSHPTNQHCLLRKNWKGTLADDVKDLTIECVDLWPCGFEASGYTQSWLNGHYEADTLSPDSEGRLTYLPAHALLRSNDVRLHFSNSVWQLSKPGESPYAVIHSTALHPWQSSTRFGTPSIHQLPVRFTLSEGDFTPDEECMHLHSECHVRAVGFEGLHLNDVFLRKSSTEFRTKGDISLLFSNDEWTIQSFSEILTTVHSDARHPIDIINYWEINAHTIPGFFQCIEMISISGDIVGILSSETVQMNGEDFVDTFSLHFPLDEPIVLNITYQPFDKQCSLNRDVSSLQNSTSNLILHCAQGYFLHTSVAEFPGELTLQVQQEEVTIAGGENGKFSHLFLSGDHYEVSIVEQPHAYRCHIGNAFGLISESDVSLDVVCEPIITSFSPALLLLEYEQMLHLECVDCVGMFLKFDRLQSCNSTSEANQIPLAKSFSVITPPPGLYYICLSETGSFFSHQTQQIDIRNPVMYGMTPSKALANFSQPFEFQSVSSGFAAFSNDCSIIDSFFRIDGQVHIQTPNVGTHNLCFSHNGVDFYAQGFTLTTITPEVQEVHPSIVAVNEVVEYTIDVSQGLVALSSTPDCFNLFHETTITRGKFTLIIPSTETFYVCFASDRTNFVLQPGVQIDVREPRIFSSSPIHFLSGAHETIEFQCNDCIGNGVRKIAFSENCYDSDLQNVLIGLHTRSVHVEIPPPGTHEVCFADDGIHFVSQAVFLHSYSPVVTSIISTAATLGKPFEPILTCVSSCALYTFALTKLHCSEISIHMPLPITLNSIGTYSLCASADGVHFVDQNIDIIVATASPSTMPSGFPSESPSSAPTTFPTTLPTSTLPSGAPTRIPTTPHPSHNPSLFPSHNPSRTPLTSNPTPHPTTEDTSTMHPLMLAQTSNGNDSSNSSVFIAILVVMIVLVCFVVAVGGLFAWVYFQKEPYPFSDSTSSPDYHNRLPQRNLLSYFRSPQHYFPPAPSLAMDLVSER